MLLTNLLGLCLIGYSTQSDLGNYFRNISSPQIYANYLEKYVASNKNLKLRCARDVTIYLNSLRHVPLPKWWSANSMVFDSGSKIPSGVLQGNLVDLGTFDQCMAVKSPAKRNPIYGKYCLGSILLVDGNSDEQARVLSSDGKINAMFATCLPNSCSSQDFEQIYNNSIIKPKFDDLMCQSEPEKPQLTSGGVVMICFLGVTLGIVVISTAYDTYLFYTNGEPSHTALIAFSVLTNGRKLFAVAGAPNNIACLHGIRVVSMMWVILGHRYNMHMMDARRNSLDIWINTEGNMYILGSTVSVDTFLLLSGLLVSYGFMVASSEGHNFNIFIYYLHRYLRLTPVYAVIIFFHITLLNYLGSGPWWPSKLLLLVQPCEDRWWAALLYIQNYFGEETVCIPQSWYLSVDTQLFLISPLLLIPLRKWSTVGYLITAGLAVASTVYVFIISYVYEFKGFSILNQNEKYTTYYYAATHSRATPWLIGLFLGHYIFQLKARGNIRFSNLLALSMWAAALGILAACVFTGHNTLNLKNSDRVADAFHVALLRPGWAVGVSMVILLCVLGYGGPINWFLSNPIFQVLSRLTYTMYLLHMTMQVLVSGQDRTVIYKKDLNALYSYWGDYMFTVGAAIIMTLAYESPIITLEKMVFGKSKKTAEKKSLEDEPQIQSNSNL